MLPYQAVVFRIFPFVCLAVLAERSKESGTEGDLGDKAQEQSRNQNMMNSKYDESTDPGKEQKYWHVPNFHRNHEP